MAAVGCPEENGYADRWMRILKEDHVQSSEYSDFWDAQAQIGVFVEEVYQKKRVHSKLGYLPPAVFEECGREAKASEMLFKGWWRSLGCVPAALGASASFQALACRENRLADPGRKCYNITVGKLSRQTSGLHLPDFGGG
jgi:hypothetical protein